MSTWSGDRRSLTTNAAWLASLDRIAGMLLRMQAAGVPVLWRPLQENNGPLFWWATENGHSADEFIALYRHLFDTFRQKKVDNLIWVYSPVGSNAYMKWPFPGVDSCDVVAPTTYNNDLNLFDAYQDALSFGAGKPIGTAEYGPDVGYTGGAFDDRKYVVSLRSSYPKVAYWVSWHDWDNVTVSLVANAFARELMTDSNVLTAPLW